MAAFHFLRGFALPRARATVRYVGCMSEANRSQQTMIWRYENRLATALRSRGGYCSQRFWTILNPWFGAAM